MIRMKDHLKDKNKEKDEGKYTELPEVIYAIAGNAVQKWKEFDIHNIVFPCDIQV